MPKAEATSKGLLESKTVWGVVIMLLASRSRSWFGVDLNGILNAEFAESLALVLGALWAILGRIKAEKKIDDLF